MDKWIAYNGEKSLDYPGKHKGRRLLLLIDAPDVAIHDFVASAHQDYDGRFWLGIPGSWICPEIGDDWTVKAWMPAPEPGEFKHDWDSYNTSLTPKVTPKPSEMDRG